MKNTFSYIVLLFLIGFVLSCDQKNDFDLVCQYFDALEQDKTEGKKVKLDNKRPNYSFSFINDRIENNISPDSAAVMLWVGVVSLEPVDLRYKIFTDAVTEALNKPWQCVSMKEYLPYIYAGEH